LKPPIELLIDRLTASEIKWLIYQMNGTGYFFKTDTYSAGQDIPRSHFL